LRVPLPRRWDERTDVVVVGCGFAGAMSAIAAHDAGARVTLLEKMPDPGGISICSVGGVRVAADADDAFAYLARTNRDTTPAAVLRALARGMADLPRRIEALARAVGATTERRDAAGNYPFRGTDTFGFVSITAIPGFDPATGYARAQGSPAGRLLFRTMELNLQHRGITPRLASAAEALVTDPLGRVRGVIVKRGRTRVAIAARRGVVLACGGFEGDPAMQRQYWAGQPVLSAAFRGNTGDGIRMAQAVGADLWHMWHYHGSYGFKHSDPAYPFGIRTKRLPDWMPGAGPRRSEERGDVRMPWILLDRRGRRFTNEYDPYLQDTGARPLDRYDPQAQDYAALPAWLIADADGHALWPFGRPTYHERGVTFAWSNDNEAEVKLGILARAADLAALARATAIPETSLVTALERWNAACGAGTDDDWGRPPSSMVPIRRAPFTYARVWPIVSNTQGGPVHDVRQRVLDPAGRPIARLYAAGELGSVFGHLYLSGGNIAECFVGGRIAGRAAAANAPLA
jgi:succinate dehydrogenase/fumarate reductase flavoprotein subunit